MNIGVNLSNRQWRVPQLTDDDKAMLLGMKPRAILVFSYHDRETWQWLSDYIEPEMIVVRLNHLDDLANLAALYGDYADARVIVQLGNEPRNQNEPWGGDMVAYGQWCDQAITYLRTNCPKWPICSGPLSPSVDYQATLTSQIYRDLVARCDYLGAHAYYQRPDQLISLAGGAILAARQAYPDKRQLLTEFCCTAGESGAPRPRSELAGEYVAFAQWANRQGFIDCCLFFILGSDDPHWDQVGETFNMEMARAIGAIELKEGTVRVAIAIVPSNQDRNLGVIAGYSEAGGMRDVLAPRLAETLEAAGYDAEVFFTGFESVDQTELEHLHSACRLAKEHLDTVQADIKLSIHLHTDASLEHYSHTAYLYESEEARKLGEAIGRKVQAALGTERLVPIKTTGYVYHKDLQPHTSALIEVCAHDNRRDLEALYGRVPATVQAIVDGVIEYVTAQGVTVDWRAEAERLRRELETATATIAERNAAIENYRAYLANIGRLAQTGLQKG